MKPLYHSRLNESLRIRPHIAVLVGLLDVSVIAAYALSISAPIWHIGILITKLAIALLYFRDLHIDARPIVFAFVIIVFTSLSTLLSGYTGDGIIRILGFCLQLILTTALVGQTGLILYMRSVAIAISISALAHVLLVIMNFIPDHYGRFSYFMGTHPNLGAEINAIGLLTAALTLSTPKFILATLPLILSTLYMQGRAAIAAMLLIVFVRFTAHFVQKYHLKIWQTITILSFFSIVLLLLIGLLPILSDAFAGLFLLNDSYRGVGTGFVGRGERWNQAIMLIAEHPFFGVGLHYYEYNVLASPHNFFLYGASIMGLLGFILFLGVIAVNYTRILGVDPMSALIISCIIPLLVFNDRMININPYPFIVYVIILIFPPWGISARSLMMSKSIN